MVYTAIAYNTFHSEIARFVGSAYIDMMTALGHFQIVTVPGFN